MGYNYGNYYFVLCGVTSRNQQANNKKKLNNRVAFSMKSPFEFCFSTEVLLAGGPCLRYTSYRGTAEFSICLQVEKFMFFCCCCRLQSKCWNALKFMNGANNVWSSEKLAILDWVCSWMNLHLALLLWRTFSTKFCMLVLKCLLAFPHSICPV